MFPKTTLNANIWGNKESSYSSEKCLHGDCRYHAIYVAVAALVLCSGLKRSLEVHKSG